jgi:hypothetical protein
VTLFTFADAYDSIFSYIGSAPNDRAVRDVRQAIDEALRDIVNAHNWSYYYKHGRLLLNPPYSTGTIGYQATGGPSPYYVTLTDGTWPSWAAGGSLRVGTVVYRVDRVLNATHLTLTPPLVPAADLASGTNYQLYQDTYLLPADFIAQDQALYESCFGALQYVHPRYWLAQSHYTYSVGNPQVYCINGDEKYPNRLVARFSPIPSDARTLDFIYKRRPRPIRWQSMSQGTVVLIAASSIVEGTGTAFDSTMTGSVFRSSANSQLPTWMAGPNPAVFEAVVGSVSAQQLFLSDVAPTSYPAARYVISDPIDIDTGSMLNAFLRCCEHMISQHRIMKDKPDARAQYRDELIRAKSADSRSFAGRAEGESGSYWQRMKDMPFIGDMT